MSAQDPPLAEALLLTLSAILIKASRQQAESSDRQVVRSLAKGQATRWFLYKAQELCRLLAAFSERVPGPPRPVVVQGDARGDLDRLAPAGTVNLVVTSPPYLGVYDYAAHHARRHAFLDLDLSPLLQAELAARRHSRGPGPCRICWPGTRRTRMPGWAGSPAPCGRAGRPT